MKFMKIQIALMFCSMVAPVHAGESDGPSTLEPGKKSQSLRVLPTDGVVRKKKKVGSAVKKNSKAEAFRGFKPSELEVQAVVKYDQDGKIIVSGDPEVLKANKLSPAEVEEINKKKADAKAEDHKGK